MDTCSYPTSYDARFNLSLPDRFYIDHCPGSKPDALCGNSFLNQTAIIPIEPKRVSCKRLRRDKSDDESFLCNEFDKVFIRKSLNRKLERRKSDLRPAKRFKPNPSRSGCGQLSDPETYADSVPEERPWLESLRTLLKTTKFQSTPHIPGMVTETLSPLELIRTLEPLITPESSKSRSRILIEEVHAIKMAEFY